MNQAIQLIVGLGNPGPHYEETRHNAGAWFVEQLLIGHRATLTLEKKFKGAITKITLHHQECLILLPCTFMNLSGEAVVAVANFYKIPPSAILIAHDELDIPVGDIRIKKAGGHGGHNGLRSVITHLHSNDFVRLRIGIGHPGDSHLVTDYVLQRPSKADKQQIEQAIIHVEKVLPDLLTGQLQKAMTELHTQ